LRRRIGLRRPAVGRLPWERAGAFVLGLLAFLVLLEVGLRWMGARAYPRPDPVRGDGGFVVLCVGDSFTAGTSEGNYPSYLGEILTQRGHAVGVLNVGLGGANSTIIREALPGFLSSVRPDLVVLLAGGTNATNYYGYSRFQEPTWWARLDDLLFSVRVWRLGRYAWTARRDREPRPPGGAEAPPLLPPTTSVDGGDSGQPGFVLPEELARCIAWNARAGASEEPLDEQVRCVVEYTLRHPEDRLGPRSLALIAQRARDPDEAESALRACIARDPEQLACLEQLGLLLLRRSETRSEALTLLRECARLQPQAAEVHMELGLYFLQERMFDEGLAEIMACIQYDPTQWACFDKLGTLARTEEQRRAVTARLADLALESPLARDYLMAFEAQQVAGGDPMADLAAWAHADLARMIEECRARGARVVVQGYPNGGWSSGVLREVALEEDLPFVDQYQAFTALRAAGAQSADLFVPDGHPTPAGYRRMAEVLADALEQGGMLPEVAGD